MMFLITTSALLLVSAHAAADPLHPHAAAPVAFKISGVKENQYGDPNGIYIRTTVRAYEALMVSKNQKNVCHETRQVETCYVQLKIFDNQPAWIILPARRSYREHRNVPNYYWEMKTTGEWQHAERVINGLEGRRDAMWFPACSNVRAVGHLARGQRGMMSGSNQLQNYRRPCGPNQLAATLPRFEDGKGEVTVIDLNSYGEGLEELQETLLNGLDGARCDHTEQLYTQADVLLGRVTRKIRQMKRANRGRRQVPGHQEQEDEKNPGGPDENQNGGILLSLQRQMAALQARMARLQGGNKGGEQKD